jgi:hypothetical protein
MSHINEFYKLHKSKMNNKWNLWEMNLCRNPNLRLATKARVCKGVGQDWAQESHIMFPGVQESVKEWTPTLPSELILGVQVPMDSQIFRGRSQGSKIIGLKSYLYH